MNLARQGFFQIPFVAVRKATTSFTHKGTVCKNFLETTVVMRCRVNHSGASTKAKQIPKQRRFHELLTSPLLNKNSPNSPLNSLPYNRRGVISSKDYRKTASARHQLCLSLIEEKQRFWAKQTLHVGMFADAIGIERGRRAPSINCS